MAVSTTTFEQRISRIQQRAAQGQNDGYVMPGVVDGTKRNPHKNAKRRAKRGSRGGYIVSALGGLMLSFVIVGAGTVFLMSDLGEGTFDVLASSVLSINQ